MEYVYIAKTENNLFRIGFTTDLESRFRSPLDSRKTMELVCVALVKEGYARECRDRLYGHLWEYTKDKIPLFNTTLENIVNQFDNLTWYFKEFEKVDLECQVKYFQNNENNA